MPWQALPWLRFEKDSGMLRILLIDDTPRKIGRLKSALIEAGFEVIDESGLTIDLPERVEAIRPDVVLIDTDSPGRDVLEQVVLVSRDQPRPIVMFTDDSDPDAMRQAIRAGVSAYIVEGIQAQRLADPRRGNGPLRKRPVQYVRNCRPGAAAGRTQAHRAGQGHADEDAKLQGRRGLHPDAPSGDEPAAEADPVAEQIIAMNELLGE